MVFGLFRKRKHNQRIVDRQYATLTATARCPYFYTDLDVPDTVMGRLEMLSVVMILFFRRTATSGVSGQELAQEIIDAFFQDIDHSIRELGIGDTSVPKRMKKLAGRFYGRLEAYAEALSAGDQDRLAAALSRNIHPETGESAVVPAPYMRDLAGWMMRTEAALQAVTEDDVATGAVMMPLPGAAAPASAGPVHE